MKNDYSQYDSPLQGLSNRELAVGAWYVRHRDTLRKSVIGVLIFINIIFWGYALVVFGLYLGIGLEQDLRMYQRQTIEFPNYSAIQPLYSPTQPTLGVPTVERSDDTYDFVTSISNPNERHLAYVTYHYQYNGGETDSATELLLPNQDSYLTIFGEETNTFPSQARLIIDDIRWQRLNPKQFPQPTQFLIPRTQFGIDNVFYSRPGVNSVLQTPQVTFDLFNDTAYSYWEGSFFVELLSGNRVVGVVPITLDQFTAGTMRQIDLRPTDINDTVNTVRLIPRMNLFDPGTYMNPTADTLAQPE